MMVRQYDRRLPEKYCIIFHSINPGAGAAPGPDAFESALELLCGLLQHCQEKSIPLDVTASFDRWRTLPIPNPAELEPALFRLAGARRQSERDTAPLLNALSGTEPGARVFLLSDVPVREWEHLLPELPFEVNCLGVSELRVKRPGKFFRPLASTAPTSPAAHS